MFYKVFVKNWDEIKKISSKSYHFVFRGHTERNWQLKPTLERAADKYLMFYDYLLSHEYLIFRSFRNVAHQYTSSLPSPKDLLEWMAILQHYGAPTRLLDFTDSLYIASFFAFEQATTDCAIWCLNRYRLDNFLIERMDRDSAWRRRNLALFDYKIDVANKLLDYENEELRNTIKVKLFENKRVVFSVKPDKMHERIAIQKGVFLIQSDLETSFESILIEHLKLNINDLSETNAMQIEFDDLIKNKLNYETGIIKLIVPREVCIEGLYDLRNMNINASTLFPGLEGQARSLHLLMRNMEQAGLILINKHSQP